MKLYNQSSDTETIEFDVAESKEHVDQHIDFGYKKFDYQSGSQISYKIKSLLDYFLIFISIPFLIFLFPIVIVGIKLSSPGPIIFKQKRIGQYGIEFNCYKFRTMHMPEFRQSKGNIVLNSFRRNGQSKPIITRKDDKRLFLFGKILRKLNLDEFPQVFNVLKQDMSFIGPRPYTVEETNYWDKKFEDFHLRYKMKPGISGYAQVVGLRGGTHDEAHMRRRLDFDLKYQEKCTFIFDLKIAFITLLQMLKFKTKAH